MAVPPNASEQDARNATVEGLHVAKQGVRLTRRSILVGAVIGIGGAYIGAAASRDLWPFEESANAASQGRPVAELATGISSREPAIRKAAVAGLAAKIEQQAPDRVEAIAALTAFVSTADHSSLRVGTRAPELDSALVALGGAHLRSTDLDLRYADLQYIDVAGLQFTDGVPLYGAKLQHATIINSAIGTSNAQTVDLTQAWLGDCQFTNVFFGEAILKGITAPSVFVSCIFAGSDVSDADFSRAKFVHCDFDGRTFLDPSKGKQIWYAQGHPPRWPSGFSPFN